MGALDQGEQHAAIGDIDGCTAQFLIERGIVKQEEILEHEQTGRLEIGIQREHGPQLIECIAVKAFGVLNQLCNPLHFNLQSYQFATVALNICSTMSLIILLTSSSCTELSESVDS